MVRHDGCASQDILFNCAKQSLSPSSLSIDNAFYSHASKLTNRDSRVSSEFLDTDSSSVDSTIRFSDHCKGRNQIRKKPVQRKSSRAYSFSSTEINKYHDRMASGKIRVVNLVEYHIDVHSDSSTSLSIHSELDSPEAFPHKNFSLVIDEPFSLPKSDLISSRKDIEFLGDVCIGRNEIENSTEENNRIAVEELWVQLLQVLFISFICVSILSLGIYFTQWSFLVRMLTILGIVLTYTTLFCIYSFKLMHKARSEAHNLA